MPRSRRQVSLLGGLALTCLGFAAAAQVIAGRWELIDYDQAHATGKSQIALWLQAGTRVKNPAPTNAYDAQALPLLSIQCVDGQSKFFINLNFEVPTGAVAVYATLASVDEIRVPDIAAWCLQYLEGSRGRRLLFQRDGGPGTHT